MRPASRSRREEQETAARLGLTLKEFRAKYAPWKLLEKPPTRARPTGKRPKAQGKVGLLARLEVYERDQGLCRYCGIELEVTGDGPRLFTIDHVKPWSCGGTKEPDNLVAACDNCNQRKGARTPKQAGMPLLPIGTRIEPVPPAPRVYVRPREAHTRDHWTSRGKPKLPWTKEEACELSNSIGERDGMAMEAFPCPECDAWHLRILPGWGKLAYRRAHDYHDSYAELGDRVTALLRQENMGQARNRRRWIYKRIRGAVKHASRKIAA